MARAAARPALPARRRRGALSALSWDGCVNVRSLPGGIVRSDNACNLSEAGRRAAWEYGIRTVVDLRSDDECRDDPPPRPELAYVRIPLSDFERPPRPEPEDQVERLRLWYTEHLRYNAAGVGAVFRVLADAQGGVLVHCLGGKDRTGIVSALVLRLAGASLEEIEADYLLSGERPAGVIRPVLEEIEPVEAYLLRAGVSPEQLSRLRYRLAS